MSFKFKWPEFEKSFVEQVKSEMETALNRGSKPSNICDTIRIKTLQMGSIAPELDILEIGEINEEKFRGILKLTYLGDANVILQTKVQANPLNFGEISITEGLLLGPGMVIADAPLIVPLELRISQVKVRGIFVLIVSLNRGVTISFKNDPLESVQVNSTFDTLPSIRKHLQREIEQRLRVLLREDIPLLIHHHSLGKIRGLAEQIPPAFRSTPPQVGYFRHRRSQSTSATLPSRADSPIAANKQDRYEEIYYFRRNGIVHRTVCKYSTCDPLAGPVITDLQKPVLTVRERLSELRDWLNGRSDYRQQNYYRKKKHPTTILGLRDPLIYAPLDISDKKYSSQSIPLGTLQIELLPVDKTKEKDAILPSVYRAPKFKTEKDLELIDGRNLPAFDPEEFRPVYSLLSQPFSTLGGKETNRSMTFSIATLTKSVRRTFLSRRLSILRSIQECPSPFDFSKMEQRLSSCTIIHRSQAACRR